ncbi:MAG: HAMP domain-containing histidine kinase [Phycisphaeraceae bacterium]|nr:HAMP domain-containing histidine kinase [Phycisphaeraceae bacterium]
MTQYNLPTSENDQLASIEQLLEHFEHLESQFKTVRESLTRSHRLTTLGTLSSIVAHELNNILTPVMSYSELALQRPDDLELTKKALGKAVAGCQRAAKISQCILEFSHTSDQTHIANLSETVKDTLACLARDPAKDGIKLILNLPDVQVQMSPLNLQQVLMNLILNARKVLRKSGGELEISGRTNGRHLHLEIRDTGPGIPPEIQETLFDAFVTQNADPNDINNESRGTGLGLCICRDLVHQVGGEIDFQTDAGQGTTFFLTLPILENLYETT